MQGLIANMLQFHSKISKLKSFQIVVFPAVCVHVFKVFQCYSVRSFEETVAVVCFKNISKNAADESEIKKIQIQRFSCKILIFCEISIVGKMKTFISEQMRYPVDSLKINCSFMLEKSLKMIRK